jgi:hypothetical protein
MISPEFTAQFWVLVPSAHLAVMGAGWLWGFFKRVTR